MTDEQQGLDFDTAPPEPQSPAPAFVSAHERKMLEWRAPRPELSGEPSGDLCAYCKQPILSDDEFGLKFGEHIPCFSRDESEIDDGDQSAGESQAIETGSATCPGLSQETRHDRE